MANLILTGDNLIRYAETRLFGRNVQPEEVREIVLHNSVKPSALQRKLRRTGGHFYPVVQDNSREPIYFQEGVLHIPQYSGFGRRTRYEGLIKAYIETIDRDVQFSSLEATDNRRITNMRYTNYAYDFVIGLFCPEEKHENRLVFPTGDARDIRTIIFGHNNAVAQQAQVIEKGESEYLESQIVEIAGQRVLNIGYVYADQAATIAEKLLREYEALVATEKGDPRIDLYMFGRVGGLKEDMHRHDLVFPVGHIDENDLERKAHPVYPFNNVFGQGDLTFNVNTVLKETMESLERARELGCSCVEMETRQCAAQIEAARELYADTLDIYFGFVGFVSDLPLQGDTLAHEMDSNKGEQAAIAKIVERIKER